MMARGLQSVAGRIRGGWDARDGASRENLVWSGLQIFYITDEVEVYTHNWKEDSSGE